MPHSPLHHRPTAEEKEKEIIDQYQHEQVIYQQIYEQHNLNAYETELVRLAEDYNLLFQAKNPLNELQTSS